MKPIPNYSDYLINEYGDILSNVTGRFLNPKASCVDGYVITCLIDDNGRKVFERVHRLVALTFLDKVEGKTIINHKDFNRSNNHISNLEWCNHSENGKHGYTRESRYRSKLKGSLVGNSILNEQQVQEMRQLHDAGVSTTYLQKKYGIKTASHICDIVYRRKWKHVL